MFIVWYICTAYIHYHIENIIMCQHHENESPHHQKHRANNKNIHSSISLIFIHSLPKTQTKHLNKMKMKTWTRETWTFSLFLSISSTYIFYFFVYKFTSSVVGPNVTRRRARDSILVFLVFFSSFCNTACFHHMCFSLRLFRYYLCMWCGLDVVTFSFLCGVASWSSWRVRKIKRANREMRGEMRFS